jgi:glycosyltransferase involved in cell wall biosynthesis
MRVAFVSEKTVFHGATEPRARLHRIARSLAARGHEVTVFCAQWWAGYEGTTTRDGVDYRAVTTDPALASFATRVPLLLARYRPDAIHASPDPPGQVLAASVGGTLARAPLVLEWYGDEDVPESRVARMATRAPGTIVTPSELVRTHVRERGATAETTRVVPESIDVDLVRETEPNDEADIVYARDLDEDANVQNLLLGLAELRTRDWSATIIGDGPERAEFESQAADLRIDDRVSFVGDVPRSERVATYRGAHTFVQTAYRESFATELCWALACGCVGIVEYQAESSAHELIETYERSFRVTDDQELADAIVDAGGYERKPIDESFERYDHDAVLDQYLDCYRELQDEQGLL